MHKNFPLIHRCIVITLSLSFAPTTVTAQMTRPNAEHDLACHSCRPELINEHNTSQQSHGVPKMLEYHMVVEVPRFVFLPLYNASPSATMERGSGKHLLTTETAERWACATESILRLQAARPSSFSQANLKYARPCTARAAHKPLLVVTQNGDWLWANIHASAHICSQRC
jgi:hypothetical protein